MERAFTILMVEDNPSDRLLATEELRRAGAAIELHTVENGHDALAFLRRSDGYESAPRPDLLLVDLGLPGMTGFELLTTIHDDPELRDTPAVVLSASDADRDIVETFGLGAREFITKPLKIDAVMGVIEYLSEYA